MGVKETYNSIAASWAQLKTKPLDFVINFLKHKKGKILFAGCGSARNSKYASDKGFRVIGFDFSLEMVKQARELDPRGEYFVADVRAIPIKNKAFNNAVCASTLHHLTPVNVVKALKELKRVANKSLISVWNHPTLKGEHLIKWGEHERYYFLYGHDEFLNLLKQVFKEFKEVKARDNFIFIT